VITETFSAPQCTLNVFLNYHTTSRPDSSTVGLPAAVLAQRAQQISLIPYQLGVPTCGSIGWLCHARIWNGRLGTDRIN
jgi:hypothetical protein